VAQRGPSGKDEALLDKAHLEGAWLNGTSLYGASLGDTQLVDALMDRAFLGKAETVAQTQIEAAWGDEDTTLPEGFTHPCNERWLPKGVDTDKLNARWECWKARHEFWRAEAAKSREAESAATRRPSLEA
jgi:hypothetical protein